MDEQTESAERRTELLTHRGRMGVYTRLAHEDTREMTAKARTAFLRRFEREVDPDECLSPAERARRAEAALQAHMAGMAYRGAQARWGKVSKKTDTQRKSA